MRKKLFLTQTHTLTLTFQCNSIASDSHDGIVDVILWGHSRVHTDYLEIHWHTAEPEREKARGQNLSDSRTTTSIWLNEWDFIQTPYVCILTGIAGRHGWPAQVQCRLQELESQCAFLRTVQAEAVMHACNKQTIKIQLIWSSISES